jgi:hypothetical protein
MYKNSVRTLWETCYISTKTNRLILLSESTALCCENHMKLVDTLFGGKADFSACILKLRAHIVTTGLLKVTGCIVETTRQLSPGLRS